MSMNEPPKDEGLDRFEQHLHGCRPVAPRALSIRSRRAPWRLIAAAAAVPLVIGLALLRRWSPPPNDRPPIALTEERFGQSTVLRPVTLGQLNAALRTGDDDLKILENASPRLLPHEHRGTALFELGKE
jgi:hypothetical protein